MTDPIADMLTRIRNASKVKKPEVYIPFSKLKLEIVKILKRQGYIQDFKELKPDETENKFGGIMVGLKYNKGKKPAITSIKRVSKPGQRVYVSKDELPKVLNNLGLAIVSTSKGVMTNTEAKQAGLGGELICEIY